MWNWLTENLSVVTETATEAIAWYNVDTSDNIIGCGSCWCTNGNDTCPERPRNHTSDFIAEISTQVPTNAYELLCNPYNDETCLTTPPQPENTMESAVCGLKFVDEETCDENSSYVIKTYDSTEEAE